MKYKYNIKHKNKSKVEIINFKNKAGLIKYLDKKKKKMNELDDVVVNFACISLPLKTTVWSTI